jgi:molybdate transport system substrate-binding protein
VRRAVLVLVLCLLTGCGAGAAQPGGDRTLTVLAAASLTDLFDDLATRFEEEHPGVRVRLVHDSSMTLATQVQEGAPGDVLATADTVSMSRVLDSGHAAEAVEFAGNVLVLVAPAGDPSGVASFGELQDGDVDYVACVETAPCGAIARRLLDRNGITTPPRSLEVDVRAVLAKVVDDEADAGLVYATDARVAGDEVRVLPVPGADDDVTTYPVAVLEEAGEPELARAWVDLLLSEEGRVALRSAGFREPR